MSTYQGIGFVGLGAMGGVMVPHLKGLAPVTVFDLNQDAAAAAATAVDGQVAGSLEDFAACELVITMLPTSAIVDAVLRGSDGSKGLFDVLQTGALIVDMSSSVPMHSTENAKKAGEHGLSFIDAPVSGGVARATTGELTIMVGGTEDLLERARPALERIGSKVVLVGAIGAGHAVKALNNLIAGTTLAVTCEAFVVGERFGLDPRTMLDVINSSSGMSFQTSVVWQPHVLPRTFQAGFSMALMSKDVGVALELADAVGVPTPVSKASGESWVQALETARQGADHLEMMLHIEQLVDATK
jgi:3-hydroxyisobutyrate dehydrogenase